MLTMCLVLSLVVNFSFGLLKTKSKFFTSHILWIWSVCAFASTCIYCCTHSTWPLRAFLHYTSKAPVFFSVFPSYISAFSQAEFSYQGGVSISTLVYAWWVHLSTRGINFEIIGQRDFVPFGLLLFPSKGRDSQGEEIWVVWSFC
jgi:hypothetical protein